MPPGLPLPRQVVALKINRGEAEKEVREFARTYFSQFRRTRFGNIRLDPQVLPMRIRFEAPVHSINAAELIECRIWVRGTGTSLGFPAGSLRP